MGAAPGPGDLALGDETGPATADAVGAALAGAAAEHVIALQSGDPVVTGQAHDHVGARCAEQPIVPGRAHEGRRAAGTGGRGLRVRRRPRERDPEDP